MESNKVSSSSSKNRFADYFVICGLDYNSGLEPDTFAGDNLQSSPLERPYKCKVLGHYPENVPWNPFDKNAVGMLCLPHGLQFHTQKHSLEPRFHSFVITRQDGKRYYGASYVFFEEVRNRKISSAMQTLQAMHLTELSSGQQAPRKHVLDHNTRSLPRHFKLASHHTRIAQNYYDHTKDTLHVTKSVALILQHPFIHAAEAFLTGLYRCWKEQGPVNLESHIYNLLNEVVVPGPGRSLGFVYNPDCVTVIQRPTNIEELPLLDCSNIACGRCWKEQGPVNLESHIYNLLNEVVVPGPGRSLGFVYNPDCVTVIQRPTNIEELPLLDCSNIACGRCWKEQGPVSLESHIYNLLYEVVVPGPGRSLGFVCYPDCVTVIQRPSNIEELPLLDYSLREMFTLLGVDCVLQLFTCMLLENQVLLCSSEYQRLMLVAECMTALLFPFTWPHVYVPILPASLQHFLDAPVPFIMGLHSRENRINIPSEANLCYVDLDSRTIQLPEELPSFPHKSEFIAEISEMLDRYKVPSNHDRIINTHADMSENSLMTTSCTLPRKHSWANELDDSSGPPLLTGPDALKRLVKLARRTGVSLDGIDGPDWDINLNDPMQDSEEEVDENQVIDEESYERELRFNNSIREIFFNRFVHIFASYEHFVIQPNQDKEQWLSNRESMQNFDKATFLSDQPQQHLPFLSRFIETQMFATLVDNKILATWSKTEPNLRVFERRIKLLRKRYGGGEVVRSPCYERCSSINDSQRLLDKRLASVDVQVPAPREMLTSHATRNTRAGFPLLDHVLLNQEPSLRSRKRSSSVQWRAPRSGLSHSLSSVSLDELDAPAPRRTPSEAHPLGTNTLKPTPNKPPPAMSPALIAQTNWNFVEKLLKDCKAKTKRMLVEKMGTEAVQMGHSTQTSLVEENTLIASLCDLLERIWSHGLHNKQGKSALWSHLLNYQELEECNDTSKPIDPNFLTPDSTPAKVSFQQKLFSSIRSGSANIKDYLPFDLSSMALETTSPATSPSVEAKVRSRSETRTSNTRRLSEETHTQPALRALPSSLTFDMRCVQAMTDIKTHIGYARAWVRLALEKKLLSRHLRTLLSDTALLKSQYKRYAFLRCDEEKEQFLYHLLTLNAVDYHCFTNTYTNTRIPYRVAIFSSQKTNAGTTTANCWLTVSGSLGETQRVPIPRGSLEFVFHHKNLGILTTLRIAHDNSGLSPKWMVEYVIVRNEVTGHTYSFPCGRWLGRGIDDDSTERLLVGERVSEHSERGRGSSSPRVRSPSVPPPKRAMPVADIQTMLGDCLNSIVKFYHHPISQDQVSSWTLLLCGETGLVACLEQVFLYGFRNVRLFGRNFYIWDFIAKVKEEKEAAGECDDVTRYYCDLVDKILSAGHSLGKDGRFQLFVCIGARDGMLADALLSVMASSRTVLEMFDEQSFLRDPSLLLYIGQILESLNQFDIVLENSLTQGIS